MGKKPEQKRESGHLKGTPPEPNPGISFTGNNNSVNYVTGHGHKVNGSTKWIRTTIGKLSISILVVLALGGGSAYLLLGDHDSAKHATTDSTSESPSAPDSATATSGETASPSPATASPFNPSTGTDAGAGTATGTGSQNQNSSDNAGTTDAPTRISNTSTTTRKKPVPTQSTAAATTPHFQVTGGACDDSDATSGMAKTLYNTSSGFTVGGDTYNEVVLASDHNTAMPTGHFAPNGKVTSSGGSGWHWLCEQNDPTGTYDVRVQDVATGRWSNWSRLVINE
ncbi:hypothetical protein [Streptomyces sp. NBC_01518]|uniref:hypothetical protein n=1 Tax=Streptomyces sp. NBC_01518 TaxID=2903891 RepID=UPI00386C4F89